MGFIEAWNYRVAQWRDDTGEPYFTMVECFYDAAGNVVGWHHVRGFEYGSVNELTSDLGLMQRAATMPILNGDDLPK